MTAKKQKEKLYFERPDWEGGTFLGFIFAMIIVLINAYSIILAGFNILVAQFIAGCIAFFMAFIFGSFIEKRKVELKFGE